jgi:putative acetyltransferase
MTAMNLRFRPATAHDIPDLTDIWVDIWRDTMPSIDFEARRPWFVERIGQHLAGGVDVVLAVDPDDAARIRGFVTIDRRDGHLDQLGVARAAMGQGVARALIAEARRRSPAGIHLEVNERNDRAVRLYESEGFVLAGTGVSAASGLPLLRYRWTPAG